MAALTSKATCRAGRVIVNGSTNELGKSQPAIELPTIERIFVLHHAGPYSCQGYGTALCSIMRVRLLLNVIKEMNREYSHMMKSAVVLMGFLILAGADQV